MALTVYPTVVFNNSTGSDTVASGAGPATAVTGTSAAHTGGVATTTITFTNSPDLSSVAQDGSAVLFLNTASGRKFTRISTVDNTAKTCVVKDTFTIAAGSAVNFAIGGKRSSLDNATTRALWDPGDMEGPWTIEIEYTGTDYTITAAIDNKASPGGLVGGQRFIGTGGRPIIKQTTNSTQIYRMWNYFMWLENLHLKNVATTRAPIIGGVSGTYFFQLIKDCVIEGGTYGVNVYGPTFLINTEILNCTVDAILQAAGAEILMRDCYIHDNVGRGYNDQTYQMMAVLHNCVFARNGDGVAFDSQYAYGVFAVNCVFAFHTGSGIKGHSTQASNAAPSIVCEECVFYGNGAYAIDFYGIDIDAVNSSAVLERCAFGANSSGNWPVGFAAFNKHFNDISLVANPFANATGSGGHDFTVVGSGGAQLRNQGRRTLIGTPALTFRDVGALRHRDPPLLPRTRSLKGLL